MATDLCHVHSQSTFAGVSASDLICSPACTKTFLCVQAVRGLSSTPATLQQVAAKVSPPLQNKPALTHSARCTCRRRLHACSCPAWLCSHNMDALQLRWHTAPGACSTSAVMARLASDWGRHASLPA